ncbi:MAG: hypothetical protein KJS68_15375, partial [Alphaproteobacteria bacterium]|nr:hypothetical protein [Alphaproteobacteria bacterium]
AAAAAAFCLLAGARADVMDFYGNWENPARDASGITHVQVSPAGGDRVSVRVYGDCHPIECNWGLVEGQSYSATPHSHDVESIVASFETGFAHKQIILRKGPLGQLTFEVLTDFSDRSGKHDFDMTGRLKRTAWAGPVGQTWERNPSQSTGWGGGVRSGASPAPSEACRSFDPKAAQVVQVGKSWKVVAEGETLADAGTDRRLALRALETIRYYRFDQKCRAGTAPLAYWKSGSTIPAKGMGGANCIFFDQTTVHDALIGHRWKIVDGVQWVADLGSDKEQAEQVLALIRNYRLGAECFVSRSNPVMVYWLSQ